MTYGQKSVSARLDGLVAWTGVPRLAKRRIRLRSQRWSSVIVVVLASAAAATCWAIVTTWQMGMILGLLGALGAAAATISAIGPLRAKGLTETEDERENLWRSRSRMAGFAVVAIVALIGVLGMALALLFSDLRSMAVTGSIEINGLPVAMRLLSFG